MEQNLFKRALSLLLCFALSAGIAAVLASAAELPDGDPVISDEEENIAFPLEMDEAALPITPTNHAETDDDLMRDSETPDLPEEEFTKAEDEEEKEETEPQPEPEEEKAVSAEAADGDVSEAFADDPLPVPSQEQEREQTDDSDQAAVLAELQTELHAKGFETRRVNAGITANEEVILDGDAGYDTMTDQKRS